MSHKIILLLKGALYTLLDFFKYFLQRQAIIGNDVMHIRFARFKQPKPRYDIRKKFFTFSITTKDDIFKYLFILLMAFLAIYMPMQSTDIGISDLEVQHLHYAEIYHNYHSSGDTTLLSTSYFSHHGQLTDNLCYAICQWFNTDNQYLIRHIMSAIFGWLTILTLGFFLVRLFGWRAAFIGATFLFISPRFIGNTFTNLTETSFAFAYLFSIYQIYLLCYELPVIKGNRLILIALGIAFANSIHIGGYFLIAALYIFPWIYFFTHNSIQQIKTKPYWANLLYMTLILAGTAFVVLILDLLYLPMELQETILNPFRAITLMMNDPHPVELLADNQTIWTNEAPNNYLLKYLFITIPFVILIGFSLFLGFIRTLIKHLQPTTIAIILFAFIIPSLYALRKGISIYEDFALYLFIYPIFILIAVGGYEGILRRVDDRYTNFVIVSVIFLLTLMPLRHVILNHPFESVYYNEISGGIPNTYGKHKLDYNYHGNKEACEWLLSHIRDRQIRKFKDVNHVLVATDGNQACKIFFEKDSAFIKLQHFPYEERHKHQWDYYISFANSVSSDDLKQELWPPKDAIKIHSLEQKPMIAIIKNNSDSIPHDTLTYDDHTLPNIFL